MRYLSSNFECTFTFCSVDLLIDYQTLYEDPILAKYLKGRHLSNTTTILTANPFSLFNDSHRNGKIMFKLIIGHDYLEFQHYKNHSLILSRIYMIIFSGLMLQGIYEINTWNVILTTKIILGQKLQV